MRFAKRLDLVPPYLFAELERKVEEKRRQGVDVISLGIGDPDLPTPEPVIRALREAAADPTMQRQAALFRDVEAVARANGMDAVIDGWEPDVEAFRQV